MPKMTLCPECLPGICTNEDNIFLRIDPLFLRYLGNETADTDMLGPIVDIAQEYGICEDCSLQHGNFLHTAVKIGDDELFKRLVDSASPVWSPDLHKMRDWGQGGPTPLHLAVICRRVNMIPLLIQFENGLERHVSLCCVSSEWLHLALSPRFYESLVGRMMEGGMSLDISDFMRAIGTRQRVIINAFLKNYRSPAELMDQASLRTLSTMFDLDFLQDSRFKTMPFNPFHLACLTEQYTLVEVLLHIFLDAQKLSKAMWSVAVMALITNDQHRLRSNLDMLPLCEGTATEILHIFRRYANETVLTEYETWYHLKLETQRESAVMDADTSFESEYLDPSDFEQLDSGANLRGETGEKESGRSQSTKLFRLEDTAPVTEEFRDIHLENRQPIVSNEHSLYREGGELEVSDLELLPPTSQIFRTMSVERSLNGTRPRMPPWPLGTKHRVPKSNGIARKKTWKSPGSSISTSSNMTSCSSFKSLVSIGGLPFLRPSTRGVSMDDDNSIVDVMEVDG